MLVFASIPAPRLADYWSTGIRIKKIKEENQVHNNRNYIDLKYFGISLK
jgi:hypothetical protein